MRLSQRAATTLAARRIIQGMALAACTHSAIAAPPQLPSDAGVLVLPNVRVETAQQPVDGKPARVQSGIKAYKDHTTGRLRKATPEEQIDEARAAPAANDPAGARITVLPGGRRSAALDDSFLSYSVARKGADGKVEQTCVAGEAAAQKALKARHVAKEHRHAH